MITKPQPALVYLFDWGNTLMLDDSNQSLPMVEWRQVAAMDGALALLKLLSQSSRIMLATGAATSNETQIRAALDRVDLGQYIERIYCQANTGLTKSAAFYQFILDDLSLPPCAAVMVGDHFDKDILAANAIGIPAIWLNTQTKESRSAPLHCTIHHLAELEIAIQ
ncbi:MULTISPECIES: HAD family hydrolase [Deefgea]|uniref:HAD hydrolase-like protein n=1 Tax=Deefgea chitinilytica TaxID=570276 RepID=A0ABS2CEJ6_9NEIS|nr:MULTISPECIES: HAD family hydrolase [Deefgea]MBM5572487.1 HAD hydrolase-like protein [Deefgea chitinilytica]MBM9889723.1 HAD family hydrolase [Deefgea sp. CFH1-16]